MSPLNLSFRVPRYAADRRDCSNVFDNYEETVTDEDCLKVLSYYRIRREDAENAIKGKSC